MQQARIGVLGLGVMGRNLALNIADRGFRTAIWNRSPAATAALLQGAGPLAGRLVATETLAELAGNLARPRAVILMIRAGDPVDATIAALSGVLEAGDIIIDGGNADFHDTRRRERALAGRGIAFLGMGVSGGAEGARYGPSLMVGGREEGYRFVRDIFEAIAARYEGAPCAALLGPDGAGHFVKTVHNGIEYADMQLIAEIWGYLQHLKGQGPAAAGRLFGRWNRGPLRSYLVEITAEILQTADPKTGRPLVEVIVDSAGQKGTGRWTVIEALRLGLSASVIEAAVGARAWSAEPQARAEGERLLRRAPPRPAGDPLADDALEAALLAGRIVAHSQGFSLMAAASEHYGWGLDLARVAEIWRAGCIIRSALLDDIAAAARSGLPHGQLFLAPHFAALLGRGLGPLRALVAQAARGGLPVPAFSAALAWLDSMTLARGTTGLIQAQRDFFGAHGFARIDGGAGHHGPWGGG